MTVTNDDDWCDWCALEIRGVPLRVDGRVFCSETCLSAYHAGSKSRSLIELPQRPGIDADPKATEKLGRLETEGPPR
ncbi:hypothetical protein [Nocardia africana]|uniref:TRASH domain-containing protein n=1 Tax=Nocardia africana TaxID=134964 RepID=A0A378X0P6_9NOCA|nr:hypothetical protein [Nocardia africana]MCC3312440.1 hypothetical protein [Nocardia africana]SUA46244.1 Uncharacterised protein [Nocardia africana]